jgi:hypothetical protein
MASIITDQFRIFNAGNFVDSVNTNSYYVFLGLANPNDGGFSRTSGTVGTETRWDSNPPAPTDNLQYLSHYKDTLLFGKKIIPSNVRRVVRKINWTSNTRYDMYRHDYNIENLTPNSNLPRLFDSDFYVMNSNYRVYICIDNGASGTNLLGNKSQDEPTFIDAEPSAAGSSNDGYVWKYLFTVPPSDVIKFDSTEYIILPNDWETDVDSEIQRIRNAGNSEIEENQIKKIYIDTAGDGYVNGTYTCNINGDGSGATALITVENSSIKSARVTAGGKGYTYGIVDLGSLRTGTLSQNAQLIPIIPPSNGHGYDIYKELGADRVLIYARFDDATKDIPIDTKFAQIGILKNPTYASSSSTFDENAFSGLYSIKLNSVSQKPIIGEEINQTRSDGKIARGYVASFDSDTLVLKYFRDRSLYYPNGSDETDNSNITTKSKINEFESSANNIFFIDSGFNSAINTSFGDNKVTIGNKVIDLGTTFTAGLAEPEINKKSGDIIYIDNRPMVARNLRQKEDVKIILEF